LLDLKVRRGGPEKLREIQTTVDTLLGVEIDAFRSERRTSRDEPEAELDVDRFLVQVNGAGVREALRLILDYEFERPNILLVEEPEIHLHPALELGMMRYLKTIGRECQIFVTTHSTNFLDTAEMRNVYLTANKGDEQSTKRALWAVRSTAMFGWAQCSGCRDSQQTAPLSGSLWGREWPVMIYFDPFKDDRLHVHQHSGTVHCRPS
jgi:AAA ATPase domain